jgi:multidrug efflux pump subunit AcrA (membrane-fusion protein)
MKNELITKLTDKNDKKLKYDFMPDVQEFIERPTHQAGKIIIFTIFLIFAVALIWACIGEIDEVATLRGIVRPENNVKVIQSSENGTITKISVKNGDFVKQGDVLVELDNENNEEQVKLIDLQIKNLSDESELYKKSLNGEKYDKSNYDSSIVDVVEAEKEEYEIERELLNSKINEAKTNLKMAENQLLQYKNALNQLLQELLPEDQTEYARQNVDRQQLVVDNAKLAVENAENALKQLDEERKVNIYQKISDNKKEISELKTQKQMLEKSAGQHQIKAPTDGYVTELNLSTIGGVVTNGQNILQIVPQDSELIIEASAKNSDIGFLQEGQIARIKVDTYSYQRYGTLEGKVDIIGKNAELKDNGTAAYPVKISVDKKSNKKLELMSGMTVTVEVKTGKKKLISFLLDPIIKHVDEGLNVR